MKRCWLLAVLCCAAVQAQSTYYLPQIVDGPLDGGNAQSAILFVNSGSADATVSLLFTGDAGSPLPVNFPGLAAGKLTVKAGASAILRSDGASSGVSGAATIN